MGGGRNADTGFGVGTIPTSAYMQMHLRPHPPLHRPPPRWVLTVLAGLAVAFLSLGPASPPADAGTYSSTLYLSGASSGVVSGGYQLVSSQGASTTARPAPTSSLSCSNCGGNLGVPSSTAYEYKYTLVDAGGETSPSAVSNTTSAVNGKIMVSNLPATGITVRLYRSSSANGPWKRVVELTNNSSPTYLDNVGDASLGALMPQAQTRTTLPPPTTNGTGYYEYAPGNALSDSSTSNDFAKVGSEGFDGKGWVVDGAGGVSFAAATTTSPWLITVKITTSATSGTASLDVGMWKVDDSGAVVGSPLIDPTCSSASCGSGGAPGVNASGVNIALASKTGSPITSKFSSVPAFSLARTQHLYVEFWRDQTVGTSSGNTVSTLGAYDGTAQITHPTANAFPNVPALSSVAARVNTTPPLSATFSDPDASDTGKLTFQLCSDAAFTNNCQSGSSASGLPNPTANGTWTSTPAEQSLPDGTYYWRAQAQDSYSPANLSGWSSPSSFTVDTVPPGAPTLVLPAAGARVKSTQLGATFVDSDSTDSGTVTFQLCSDANCTSPVAYTSGTVSGGTAVSWTPTGVADGTYYWRLLATDAAGNQTAWTASRSFVLDTNPPGVPSLTSPADASYLDAVPALSATFSSSDVGDSGTVNFRVCSDSGCTTLVQSGSSAGGSWTPSGLPDGTYYWQASAVDAAGNQSAPSAIHSFTVDTVPPTVSGVTASNLNGAYKAGQTIHVQVSFSEPVNVTGSPKLALNTSPAESAAYASGSGSTLTFDYTVQAGDNVATLDYTGTGALTLNGGTIADLAGNDATLTLASPGAAGSLAANKSIAVDTVAPTVTNVTSSPANGAYKASAPVPITVRFSEPVTVDTSGGTPTLALSNGATATYASSSGTDLTFTYIVGSGDTNTTHLAYAATTPLVLHGATIRDAAHNDATLTLPSPGSAGSLDANTTIAVDTIPPTVTSVTSTQASGSYKAGTVIPVTVNFSEPVVVTGTPTLALNTAPAENATYSSGSGTSALVFDYTVQAGDNVADLDYAATTSLGLNSGSLADPAGNNATLTLASPGALSASTSIRIDTNPPATPTLNSPADTAYLGAPPTLNATFSGGDADGDSGTILFQICSDSGCNSGVTPGSSASLLANGAGGSWTPGGLADGLHYWRARAQDAAGNLSGWSGTQSFTLDTTPPSVPPLGSVAARVNTTPQLSSTFSDPGATDSGTLSFQLCSNSSCTTVLQSNTTGAIANGASGYWTPGSLADGTYYWRARAQDSAGNQSAWSATSSFVMDTVPPGLPAFVSPVAGARVNTTQLQAAFVDSDSSDSGTVDFQLCSDAACSGVLASNTSSPAVIGGTAVSWTPGGLADGTYYWRLRATDFVGNQTGWTATRSFVFDTNPPGVPGLVSPADTAYLGAPPALSGTFTSTDVGDSGTVSFQVCSDAACSSVQASGASSSGLTSGASGSWTPGGLADGLHYWRARAQDAAGNLSGWSGTQSFTLDTTPPSVPVETAPGNGVRLNQPSSLNATYADAGGDTGSVIFQVCTTSACRTVAASTTVTGMLNNAGAGWTPGSLSDGTYYWRARAEDSGGNLSAWSAARSFTIDSTPPVAPALVGFAGVHVRTAPALTALVDDPGDPADKVRLLVELCTDPACTQVVTTGYSGSVPGGTLAGWQAPKLSDGPYYWRARAEDIVGNQSLWSAVDSFVVDTRAPAVPAAAGPAVGAIVNTARLSAAVTGLSRGGGSGLEFQVCADAACTKVVASGYVPVPAAGTTPTWTPTGLRDGSYFWRLSAHDQAGNESAWSETMSFVLDQTPPGKPRGLEAKVKGKTVTLRWKEPSLATNLAGYVLIVNGRRARVVAAKTLSVHITLKKGDARLFAVAAFDAAGNVGRPATVVGPDLIRLTLKQARGAAAPKPPVQPHRP